MKIDINTKFITLIGKPLGQSFAARMQNAAYEAAGLNMLYFYTEADSTNLAQIVDGIRYMPSFTGCAVTKPNKVNVLQYLDELDPLCRRMGACNTVVRQPDGSLKGYNTDGTGFLLSIKEETDFAVEGAECFCIGAGGAGRAICFALADSGVKKLYICASRYENACRLADDINSNYGDVAEAVNSGDFSKVGECGLIINASGVGMGASVGQSPIPAEYLTPGQLCFDACYNPDKTQFLLDAEEKGCSVLNGLGMSLYQGVAQIELWSGKAAPVDTMREELKRIVQEKAKESEGKK